MFKVQGLLRRGAGVVERDGFENRCGLTSTQGSNPCLSAIFTPAGDGDILKISHVFYRSSRSLGWQEFLGIAHGKRVKRRVFVLPPERLSAGSTGGRFNAQHAADRR